MRVTRSPNAVPAIASSALSQGASGPGVRQLQEALSRAGFDPQGVDGQFGPHTRAAVVAFQQAHGLSADGVVGPSTLAALSGAPAQPQTTPLQRELAQDAFAPGAAGPVPTSASGGAAEVVHAGSSGSAVSELQQHLAAAGCDPGGVDGVFGQRTLAALLQFQSAHGLDADGVCGPATWAALLDRPAGNPAPIAPRPPALPQGGGNPAEVARQFLGQTEYQLQPSGALDMDRWVPKNVDCANFVSGCLEKAGLIGHAQRSDSVPVLANNLRSAGWRDTPLANAQPGDVVCFDGPEGRYQHVEIFNGWVNGQPQFIGSNNVLRDGTQAITTDTGHWAHAFHVLSPPGR